MCKMQLSLQPDILEIIPSRLLLKPAFPGRKPALSMYKQIGMGRSFFPMLLAVSFVLASSAMGQEPAQSPDPSPDHSQTPQPEGGQDDRNREKDKSNETVGKSKIEKETGTINDRIFEVLPNYGTVENTKNLPPMTTRQKFRLATAGVFDWGSYPFNGILAGIAQAKNDPKEWGQGWGAFGKRYGASFADNSIGTYMTTAIFPSLLCEDPRCYQMGKRRFTHRAYHAINRLFIVRTDSGHNRFNFSESGGNAAAAAISNVYHVSEDRTASRTFATFAFLLLYDGMNNELKEFWPDIRRKVFHKDRP